MTLTLEMDTALLVILVLLDSTQVAPAKWNITFQRFLLMALCLRVRHPLVEAIE